MIGSILGHFKLLEKLGEGGMGAVYRAKDLKLGRAVAIKVLPPALTTSPDRKARFIHEAKAASALNHPNIVTIYEIGCENGIDYIAMECVEGRTLADHIAPSGLPQDETVRLALQFADGLAKAHGARIIHRDLKPANVMLSTDGLVKILDFGLAKLTQHQPIGADDATLTGQLTEAGVILGTVAYMSPEQAEGRPVDARSDIFSFGAVLYEMATGRRAFKKSSPTATMAAVLRDSADTKGIPSGLAAVITRCLHKEADRRFQTMAEVRDALLQLSGASRPEARKKQGLIGAVAAGIALVAGGAWWWGSRAERLPPMKVAAFATEAAIEIAPSISPDGSQIAYCRAVGQRSAAELFVKRIGSPSPQKIASSCMFSAWSPDGSQLAFAGTQDGRMGIHLVSPQGGPERRISDTPGIFQLSWSPDGKFLAGSISARSDSPQPGAGSIVIIPVSGGEAKFILKPNPGQRYGSPEFHPKKNRLGFTACEGSEAQPACRLMSVDLDEQQFPVGQPRAHTKTSSFIHQLSWSASGDSLVYSVQNSHSNYLWQVDAAGGEPVRIELAGAMASNPTISRSGNRAAFERSNNNTDVWKMDERGAITSVIGSNLIEYSADYSPDGSKIVYASPQGEILDLWTANSDGTGQAPLTNGPGTSQGSPRWSPDGKWISFDSFHAPTGMIQIWLVSSQGGTPRQLTHSPKSNRVPAWSQDSKHLYFNGEVNGRREIFRMPIDGGPAVQVTTAGGYVARESPDGKTLYFTKGPESTSDLFAMPTAGGEERKVFATRVFARGFQPYADGIYYTTWVNGQTEIRFHEFATGKDRTIGTFENFRIYLSVSPDRKFVLFSGARRIDSDIMLIENFR